MLILYFSSMLLAIILQYLLLIYLYWHAAMSLLIYYNKNIHVTACPYKLFYILYIFLY